MAGRLSRRERDPDSNLPAGYTFEEKPVFGYERRFFAFLSLRGLFGLVCTKRAREPPQGEGMRRRRREGFGEFMLRANTQAQRDCTCSSVDALSA